METVDNMRRIAIVGLSIVATLASSALVASVAEAAPPAAEVGLCLKAPKSGGKYTGRFTGKECQVAATSKAITKGTKNKYEWYSGLSGVGVDGTKEERLAYKAKLEGAIQPLEKRVILKMPGLIINSHEAKVTCITNTAEGKWTGASTGEETVHFQECSLNAGGGQCTTIGSAPGEITTSQLDVALFGYENNNRLQEEESGPGYPFYPGEGSAWAEDAPAAGHSYAEYTCGTTLFKTTGKVAGKIVGPVEKVDSQNVVGNVMQAKFITSFGPGAGIQDLRSEYSENGGVSWTSAGLISLTTDRHSTGGTFEIRKMPTVGEL
jgi:hypothetical protein